MPFPGERPRNKTPGGGSLNCAAKILASPVFSYANGLCRDESIKQCVVVVDAVGTLTYGSRRPLRRYSRNSSKQRLMDRRLLTRLRALLTSFRDSVRSVAGL